MLAVRVGGGGEMLHAASGYGRRRWRDGDADLGARRLKDHDLIAWQVDRGFLFELQEHEVDVDADDDVLASADRHRPPWVPERGDGDPVARPLVRGPER